MRDEKDLFTIRFDLVGVAISMREQW